MIKAWHFPRCSLGSISGLGTEIPHQAAVGAKKKVTVWKGIKEVEVPYLPVPTVSLLHIILEKILAYT